MTKGPRAMGRVLDLLQVLSLHPEGLNLTELSVAVAVPKSTLLASLRGLCEDRYLLASDGRYRLGSAAHRLASAILASWSAPDAIRVCVRQLGRKTHESVGFAIADWDIGQAIYTDAVNSTQPVHYQMRAGIRAPLYASAAGRVLLAYAEPERTDAYLAKVRFRQFTPQTRTSIAAVREQIAQIRRDGYCASFGEMLQDTAAIAVPVFGPDAGVAGALMLAAPLDRMRANFSQFLAELIEAGRDASAAPAGAGS